MWSELSRVQIRSRTFDWYEIAVPGENVSPSSRFRFQLQTENKPALRCLVLRAEHAHGFVVLASPYLRPFACT
jgi:hypothetical protein